MSDDTLWEALPAVYALMDQLIRDRHPNLAVVSDKIAILFQEKVGMTGGVPVLGKTSKASRDMRVLLKAKTSKEYIFILKISANDWVQEMNDKEREALLDHCLCGCGVEIKKDGSESYKVLKPDLQLFSSNITQYGLLAARPQSDEAELAFSSVEDAFKKSQTSIEPVKTLEEKNQEEDLITGFLDSQSE